MTDCTRLCIDLPIRSAPAPITADARKDLVRCRAFDHVAPCRAIYLPLILTGELRLTLRSCRGSLAGAAMASHTLAENCLNRQADRTRRSTQSTRGSSHRSSHTRHEPTHCAALHTRCRSGSAFDALHDCRD